MGWVENNLAFLMYFTDWLNTLKDKNQWQIQHYKVYLHIYERKYETKMVKSNYKAYISPLKYSNSDLIQVHSVNVTIF